NFGGFLRGATDMDIPSQRPSRVGVVLGPGWFCPSARWGDDSPDRIEALSGSMRLDEGRRAKGFKDLEVIREATARRPETIETEKVTAILGRFAAMHGAVSIYGYEPAPSRRAS